MRMPWDASDRSIRFSKYPAQTQIDSELAAFCAEHGLEYYFPIAMFREEARKRPLYFDIDSHPNEYGNALAARTLLDVLDERHYYHFEVAESDRDYMYSE